MITYQSEHWMRVFRESSLFGRDWKGIYDYVSSSLEICMLKVKI